jgi:hypothetical protein
MIFFEPYLFSNRGEKARCLFDTFELQLNTELLRAEELVRDHFEFLWEKSLPYERWEERRGEFHSLFDRLRQLWQG